MFQSVDRKASRIEIRDALSAGISALTTPMIAATPRQAAATGGSSVSWRNCAMNSPGAFRTAPVIREANAIPNTPPTSEITTASPRIIQRIVAGVYPSVFKIPTSRTRSRTDIAIVFAETRRIVNVTAPTMASKMP